LVKVKVRRGSGDLVEIELPGTWLPGCGGNVAEVHDLGLGRRRKARSLGSRLEQLDSEPEAARQPPPPPDSGEGEPPPPPAPPPPPMPEVRESRPPRPRPFSGGGRHRPGKIRKPGYYRTPSWVPKALAI